MLLAAYNPTPKPKPKPNPPAAAIAAAKPHPNPTLTPTLLATANPNPTQVRLRQSMSTGELDLPYISPISPYISLYLPRCEGEHVELGSLPDTYSRSALSLQERG